MVESGRAHDDRGEPDVIVREFPHNADDRHDSAPCLLGSPRGRYEVLDPELQIDLAVVLEGEQHAIADSLLRVDVGGPFKGLGAGKMPPTCGSTSISLTDATSRALHVASAMSTSRWWLCSRSQWSFSGRRRLSKVSTSGRPNVA
jgi:hypothetical protein